jgi:hypothetical protein
VKQRDWTAPLALSSIAVLAAMVVITLATGVSQETFEAPVARTGECARDLAAVFQRVVLADDPGQHGAAIDRDVARGQEAFAAREAADAGGLVDHGDLAVGERRDAPEVLAMRVAVRRAQRGGDHGGSVPRGRRARDRPTLGARLPPRHTCAVEAPVNSVSRLRKAGWP